MTPPTSEWDDTPEHITKAIAAHLDHKASGLNLTDALDSKLEAKRKQEGQQGVGTDSASGSGLDTPVSLNDRRDRKPIFAAAALALALAGGLLAAFMLDGGSDDPSLAVEGTDPTPSDTAPTKPVFAEHERWVAVELDGKPILDGPWIQPNELAGWEADGTIGGCVLGSEYPWVLDGDRLVADEKEALGPYRCTPVRMSQAQAEAVRSLAFGGADTEIGPFRLDLVNDDYRLTFRPVPTEETLTRSWTIDTANSGAAGDEWSIEFPSAPAIVGSTSAELVGCGVETHEVFFAPGRLQLTEKLIENGQVVCDSGDTALLEHLSIGASLTYLVAPNEMQLLNEAGVVELRRAANQPGEVAIDLFAEHDYWLATTLDNNRILDGPVLQPDDTGNGTIKGCNLGSTYGWSLESDQFVVGDSLGDKLDCTSRMDEAARQTTRLLLTTPASTRIGEHLIELEYDGHVMTFQPVGQLAELQGSWTVVRIDGNAVEETWVVDFDGTDGRGAGQLRGCDNQEFALWVARDFVGFGLQTPNDTATPCGSRDQDMFARLQSSAHHYLFSGDRLRLLNEVGTVELRRVEQQTDEEITSRRTDGPPSSEGATGRVSITQIEASASEAGTTEVVLTFDAELPQAFVARPIEALEEVPSSANDLIALVTQRSTNVDENIMVCGDQHSFPSPGNQTTELILPSDLLNAGVGREEIRTEWSADSFAPGKIFVCEPENGNVQISIWGSAASSPEQVEVFFDAHTIRLEMDPATQGQQLAPGETVSFTIGTHCGVRVLPSAVDNRSWITDEAQGDSGWIPDEWREPNQGMVTVELELSNDASTLSASLGGRTVTYRPTTPEDGEILCA